MSLKPRQNRLFLPAVLLVAFILSASSAFADCPNQFTPASKDSFHLLVLGDSIMWGQGLRDDEKFSSRVKCWLQKETNREVDVHVEAHSGAVISGAAPASLDFRRVSGEVNQTFPTINQQLDQAIQFYKERRTMPSLILMNGCINDVGVKNLLAASTTMGDLRARVEKSCGEDMTALLQRVRNGFPEAQVLVAGYYPIVSPKTADNAFLRLLVKNLNSQRPEARRMTDKEMRQRLIAISDEWYKTSTANLIEAVRKTNAATESQLSWLKSSPPRVSFVEIEFGPEHVFAAPETLLWNFMFGSTNVSGLTKIIVLLSFGTAAYKPNDHVRESRVKSCEETYKKPKGIKEDKAQKAARQDLFLTCRYASLGHPNHMGALIYAEAIKGQLLQLIEKVGWKRDISNPQTLP